MLEEQEALQESFATARKEERTRSATAHAVRAEASPHGPSHVSACPQFPVGIFDEAARIMEGRCGEAQGL
jgi:hypothetical protein